MAVVRLLASCGVTRWVIPQDNIEVQVSSTALALGVGYVSRGRERGGGWVVGGSGVTVAKYFW